ncbi:MAG TPA: mechanosensitive ion channel family protein [Candidatus Eisenbacteria bacterium]|jgi:small-conductance mechanosensitive channel
MSLSSLEPWIAALAALVGMTLLGPFLRAVLLRRVQRLFDRTETKWDDLALKSIRRHVPVWFLLGGLALAAHLAPITERIRDLLIHVAAAGFSLSVTLAVASFAVGWLHERTVRAGAEAKTTSLLDYTMRAAVLSVGLLVMLSNLGIAISPILTALGVGSLAVALALQPTLSNYFAGLHLALARPIRVGDYISLESGQKGYVVDIGWRATRIRELPNNVIVVPNARVVEMILTNYNLPEPEQAALVEVGVSYGSDLERVERVTIEVAKQVLRDVTGGVAQFDPFIRYHTFGNSSIDFTVILRVSQFVDRYLVTHEFVKRLKRRYEQEGIEIPFPQRVVHMLAGGH